MTRTSSAFGGVACIPLYSHAGQLEESGIWASDWFAWC